MFWRIPTQTEPPAPDAAPRLPIQFHEPAQAGPLSPAISQPRKKVRSTRQPRWSNPITQWADSRWLLARRIAEQLEGEILRPEKRDRLMKLGRLLGLSTFDTTMVIAIMQDRARRGELGPEQAPSIMAQLSMIGIPLQRRSRRRWRRQPTGAIWSRLSKLRKPAMTILILLVVLLVQTATIWWVFRSL